MRKRSTTSAARRSRSTRGGSARMGRRQTMLRARPTRTTGGRRTAARARKGTTVAAHITTDHDAIREWTEERGGWPATVARTARGDATGIVRIDFPGYSGEDTLKPISWDDWFEKLEDGNLAFLYQERTADGKQSRFFKLIERE